MIPIEPLHYRLLLDKNVACDWKFIVAKILYHNDQQGSIFPQSRHCDRRTSWQIRLQEYDIEVVHAPQNPRD